MNQVNHGQSLIPQNKTYKQHLRHYQDQTQKMGLKRCHGLRHAYAQRRYSEITRQLSSGANFLASLSTFSALVHDSSNLTNNLWIWALFCCYILKLDIALTPT